MLYAEHRNRAPENQQEHQSQPECATPGNDLLTVAQVAKATNYSQEHIRRLIRNGEIPAKTLTGKGRKYFIERQDLDRAFTTKEEHIRELAREAAARETEPTSEEKAALRGLLLNVRS